MTTIGDIFEIPEQVHQGDFVLKLTEGVTKIEDTLKTYVVTPQLVKCFDSTLGLVKSAVESRSSKGAYLHGSFGSGKSHFMAIVTLILQHNPSALSIPELAQTVTKHQAWLQGRKILVVPYHMIGAKSMESAVLGHYAEYVRRMHPEAETPGFYRAEALFRDAENLRQSMGDAAFFEKLGGTGGGGWGSLGEWDAESFAAAIAAPPGAEDRIRLVSRLVDTYFQYARDSAADDGESFISLDEGLSVMSKHAQSLGYDAVVLFLDELILWLASHAGNAEFVAKEGQKVAKLVEAMVADRPIPIVSFIARQRDLRELVGEHMPGAEQLGFADILNYWEARFDTITLEDRNLPAIAEKRLLRPKSDQARQILEGAFDQTAKVREEVMNTLLTRTGNKDEFRQVYPFSPAMVQALIALSSFLQRERTALKLMMQLLVQRRDSLAVGEVVPVGDLFDVIMDGDEPFMQAMKLSFDNAKRFYQQKVVPILEAEHGTSHDEVEAGAVDKQVADRFRNDARLIKTLILSALAPGVDALSGLTPMKLAALNHGTIRSPIQGQEGRLVLQRLQKWAAQIGEIKISEDSHNPLISLQLIGVDTEGILENAKINDNVGARIQKVRSIIFNQLGITDEESLLPPTRDMVWRGTKRSCEILFRNVRELHEDNLKASEDTWRIIIDFPFDRETGRTPKDDLARLQDFQDKGLVSDTLVWLPSFLSARGLNDLGKLVVLDHVLQGNNLSQYAGHLSLTEREQARTLLQNQRDQMAQRIRACLLEAYGISKANTGAVDTSHELHEHFLSLNPALTVQPPVGATFSDSLSHLFAQALDFQFPAHPEFGGEGEIKRADLKKVLEVNTRAIQSPEGRVEVDKPLRDLVRRVAVPLDLGDMGETHLALRQDWASHFKRKQAEAKAPTVTVRQLREWIDQPERRGLPKDMQNLLILTFAMQTNRTFLLHGGPVEPPLEALDDAMELREQTLPAPQVWEQAVHRAGAIFGLTSSPLLNATSVAKLVDEITKEVARFRASNDRLVKELSTRLQAQGLDVDAADRIKTARSAVALLDGLASADRDDIVALLAAAKIETSETALATSIKQAETVAHALQATEWGIFDTLANLVASGKAPDGEAAQMALQQALQHDEYVTPLAASLKAAQAKAMSLINRAIKEADNASKGGATGGGSVSQAKPVPVQPTAGKGIVETKRAERDGLGASDAVKLLKELEAELQKLPNAKVDVHVVIYTPGEAP